MVSTFIFSKWTHEKKAVLKCTEFNSVGDEKEESLLYKKVYESLIFVIEKYLH